jgi:2-amino-4-hydroxy-6-hydroxymethyldihydropteridine diphosphokinase
MRAVLSIGSNMADSWALLRSVHDEFARELVAASPVYATPAWGGVEQEDFLNAVLIVDVDTSPIELLRRGQRLEQAADRVRIQRWGPRTLDVDVISLIDASGPVISSTEELTVPHRHAHERAFVLVPWLAADPDAELAGTPVASLIERLDASEVADIREVGSL